MVFQNPDNQIIAAIVEDDVAFGPENLGVPTDEIRQRVREALQAVHMEKYRKFAPHLLSGGQKQRIAIAGALAMHTHCLVLDEPTAMFGTDGADTIVTSDQATQVFAGKGDDVIRSGNGGNMLSGGQGNDMLYGGSGDDFLSGEEGADQLYGNGGNDVLYGGAGDDSLYGGSGDDLLYGGSGNDTLTWDAGNDILFGNEGNDTFAIAAGAAGQAEIKWDRNFTNFGQDIVDIQGAMAIDGTGVLTLVEQMQGAGTKLDSKDFAHIVNFCTDGDPVGDFATQYHLGFTVPIPYDLSRGDRPDALPNYRVFMTAL